MRHVRFRGKILQSKGLLNAGDWIEGGYYRDDCYGGCPEGKHYIISFNSAYGGFTDLTEVDGKTVGEWTGLRDKNGKGIFEGDIVKREWVEFHPDGDDFIGVVKFVEGAFCIEDIEDPYHGDTLFIEIGTNEVIGNVHEHRHLLEQKDSESTESA